MESKPKRKDLCGRALSLQLCCATAVPCCALCMLGAGRALLCDCCVLVYFRCVLVLWCALQCVLRFSAVHCAAWPCCAMCVVFE